MDMQTMSSWVVWTNDINIDTIETLGPSKCPVYVKLPSIGCVNQFADKISGLVMRYFKSVKVKTMFTITSAFSSS